VEDTISPAAGVSGPTEAELSADLVSELTRLGERCVFHPEVWMLCWTHSLRQQADRLRIDYVAEIDGRLIGIEVKAAAEHAAELGRDLVQCAQYAAGIIAANRPEVPQHWIGKPLAGVFLRTKYNRQNDWMERHTFAAHRLYGPANVGFLVKEKRGLCLRLCGERWWTEWRGWNQGRLTDHAPTGSGKFRTDV
jgi:hypothetical protein